MEVVRANGLEIAYERVGEGPPLVFVHGAASDARGWRPQLDALADEFSVVAWDEPGAGRSSDLPAGFNLADYASCLAALIEELELGPAHVAGLSWGGTVAQELYRIRPGLVATLILAGSYAGWKGSLPAEEVAARVEGVRRMLEGPPEDFDSALPGLFAGDPPPEFVLLLEEIAADIRPQSVGVQLFAMAAADQRDLLPRIAVPTLLIWGELDARSPLGVASQFQEAIPNTQLVVIPDCGHVSNLERPEAFNRAVREFCRAHSPRDALGQWPRAETIRTPRLTLEPLRAEHAKAMVSVLGEPSLYRHIGGAPPSPAELEARYERQAAGASPDGREGWLNWIIRIRDADRLAGFVQATLAQRDAVMNADLAWVIGSQEQGRGLATEAATAVVGWLREAGIGTFTAHIHPDNGASATVAARLGLSPTSVRADGEVRWASG